MQSIQILIIDLGSQYTLIIGRTLRELGVRSAVLSAKKVVGWLKTNTPKGIILSGGDASVYENNAPFPPKEILSLDVPILGICYGMHWLVQELGGKITSSIEKKEYGRTSIFFKDSLIFSGIDREGIVWASHGDSVEVFPSGFDTIALSRDSQTIAGIQNSEKKIWGLQFHPEVVETSCGKTILQNFLTSICSCKKDWKPQDIVRDIQNEIEKAVVGEKAIIGFSGGVDSSTLSAILSFVLKQNLLAVCIDTGALRQNEISEIKTNAKSTGIRLRIIRASSRFQRAIGSTTHSETKRKRFKKLYGRILEEAAKKFSAKYIVQGSLATDIIESGGTGEAALIKSHHNIGLNLRLEEIHPFRNLFKYEVREIARALNLPVSISERQPFPGPGLFIRIVGAPPKTDKLAIVRRADTVVTEILKKHQLYKKVSQLIVALSCVRSVGIKGDARVYAYSIIVRAVATSDFMTASGYQFPAEIRREITTEVTKHPKIVRVHFDETNKPPATTELE